MIDDLPDPDDAQWRYMNRLFKVGRHGLFYIWKPDHGWITTHNYEMASVCTDGNAERARPGGR